MQFRFHFVLAVLGVVFASSAAALDQDAVQEEAAAVNGIRMR
jgi:hypothetical protein